MRPSDAHALAVELAGAARSSDRASWARGASVLAAMDGREWLTLDHAARSYGADGVPVRGVRHWLGPSLDEPTGFVAAVTSLHVDGKFRERAAEVLADLGGDVATRALSVRLLDHVPEVRRRASSAMTRRVSSRDLGLVLDTLLAGRGRAHAGEAFATVNDLLPPGTDHGRQIFRELTGSGSRRVRRWAYATAHRRGLLEDAELVAAAVGDEDQWVQSRAASWLMDRGDPDLLRPLLRARSVEARLVALTRVPAQTLGGPVLERLLVDRAPRVREHARWRARRMGIDHVATYRALAVSAETPRARAGAVEALGAVGDTTDLPVVEASLADPSPRVRTAAITATATAADPAEAVSLLVPLLDDASPRVSRAASLHLTRLGADPALAADAWTSSRASSRRAAWRVGRSPGGWDRVETDLRASTDPDGDLATLGTSGLRNWLDVRAATTWAILSDDQRGRITTYLRRSPLRPEDARKLAFHAGIREYPPVERPAPPRPSGVDVPHPLPRRWWWPFSR